MHNDTAFSNTSHDDSHHNDQIKHNITMAVVDAARRGWSPADIAHVVGEQCLPLLYLAAPRVPAHVSSPELRREWLTLAPPPPRAYRDEELFLIFNALVRLPCLHDIPAFVTDAHVHQRRGSAGSGGEESKEERIRAKISALLRKAESTQYDDEAAALIAKAQSLQHRYRIEESARTHGEEKVVVRRIRLSAPYVKHQYCLVGAVARPNGCEVLLVHDKGIVAVFGSTSDTRHVIDLFESLNRQCQWYMQQGEEEEAALCEAAGYHRSAGHVANYRRSFIMAYAARIESLLDEATAKEAYAHDSAGGAGADSQQASAAGTVACVSLTELDSRRERAGEALSALFPHLRRMNLSANSLMGTHAGHSAAERSHLKGDSAGVAGRRQLSA